MREPLLRLVQLPHKSAQLQQPATTPVQIGRHGKLNLGLPAAAQTRHQHSVLVCRGNGMSLAVMSESLIVSQLAGCRTFRLHALFSDQLRLSAVYITANISGGHLNPAVTLATIVTGHISVLKGLAYILMQICGACLGILIVVSTSLLTGCQYVCCACTCYASKHNISTSSHVGWVGPRQLCWYGQQWHWVL